MKNGCKKRLGRGAILLFRSRLTNLRLSVNIDALNFNEIFTTFIEDSENIDANLQSFAKVHSMQSFFFFFRSKVIDSAIDVLNFYRQLYRTYS